MLYKLFTQLKRRKLIAGVALVVIISGAYLGLKELTGDTGAVEYVTITAERGTLVSSITGSGQVSVSDRIDILSKVSGDLVYLNATVGQAVSIGTLLAQVDSRDAAFELESEQISYQKLITNDPRDILNAENAVQRAEEDLIKAYDNGFNDLVVAFAELADIIEGLDDLYNDSDGYLDTSNWDSKSWREIAIKYRSGTTKEFTNAKKGFENNLEVYNTVSRSSERTVIEQILLDTYDVAKIIAESAKEAQKVVDFVRKRDDKNQNNADQARLDVVGFVVDANGQVTSLLAASNTIIDNRRNLKDAELDFVDLKNGPDELDLRSAELSLRQKERVYADHFIRAPFEGIVASVNVSKGKSISSGTIFATLITEQKIAEITLNEIDVAQIEIDQLATLTFDAVEGVTLTGKVTEIDILGTVTQGVVTYDVKIAFDTQDERIKPGMTIDASIITNRKDSIVLVPNAAVQTRGGQIFVDILENGVPRSVSVEVGLSNELTTEIISGIDEGVQVVTARLGGESSSQTASVNQSFRIPGIGGGGGGFRGGGFQQH